MAEETEKKQTYTYTVYMVDGKTRTVKASNMVISAPDNRVLFVDVEGDEGEWTFFISGIAAIQRQPEPENQNPDGPENPNRGGIVRVAGRILG